MCRMNRVFLGILSLVTLIQVPVWAEEPNAYFEWLSGQPDLYMARGYRTNAEIDMDTPPKGRPNAQVRYDAIVDAAKMTIPANSGSLPLISRVDPMFDGSGYKTAGNYITDGNLLITWDARWDSGYLDIKSQGVETHKEFQIGREGSGESRGIEIRTRYVSSDSTYIGKIDLRTYDLSHAGDAQPMGRGGCSPDCQLNEFDIQAETWTRYWAFLDFDNDQLSFWVADEQNAAIKLFDRFSIGISERGFNNFWFEYNTSQSRTGPEMFTWFRNLVILRNIDRSTVQEIVNQGSTTTPKPSAPTNLTGQ